MKTKKNIRLAIALTMAIVSSTVFAQQGGRVGNQINTNNQQAGTSRSGKYMNDNNKAVIEKNKKTPFVKPYFHHQIVIHQPIHHQRPVYVRRPVGAFSVYLDGIKYYYFDGNYYRYMGRGLYMIVTPPALVARLPRGCVKIEIAPHRFGFAYRGIRFLPANGGFIIL